MEEVINIYNASRRMNSVQDEDIKYNNMSGPNMMAIDRAINRSRNKYGPKKMRD
jgi:hypothetical protein